MAEPQDDAQASTAPKLAMDEGVLDFREPALTLHNKARIHHQTLFLEPALCSVRLHNKARTPESTC